MNHHRRLKVARYLYENQGRWIPGYELANSEVGGSEGLKRLRELRAKGWPIDKRKVTGSTAYEYRLSVDRQRY